MAGNKSINAAAKAKQDEFYTQLTDIEKELRYYSTSTSVWVLCFELTEK